MTTRCKNCGRAIRSTGFEGLSWNHANGYFGCGRVHESEGQTDAEFRGTFGPHALYAEPEDD